MTTYRERSQVGVVDPRIAALQRGTDRFRSHRAEAVSEFAEMDEMRDRAQAIRHRVLADLSGYVDQFTASVERVGGRVHRAADSEAARKIISELVADRMGAPIIKSKSMATEEIGLNHHLEALGHEVVETDLGEFIIQLAGEPPVHIIAPALDRTRHEIGQLFSDQLGVPFTSVPTELNQIARLHLREIFLRAGVGITGVNFGVAATGSVVTVTNEGNGRLTSTTPPLHIAVMGIERLVPDLADLEVMLEVLARSATGQRLSVYTNILTGPRRAGEPDGPDRLEVVILDNRRTSLLGTELEEVLGCIRCGACLNACPVYRHAGGRSYGSVYPGPVGAVLSPALFGLEQFGDLAYASTLCGACLEVCPIRIDLPRMLLFLRQQAAATHLPPNVARGVRYFTVLGTRPALWRGGVRLASALRRLGPRWITRMPGAGRGWTSTRDLPWRR